MVIYKLFLTFFIVSKSLSKRNGYCLSKKDKFGGYKKNMNGIIIFFTKAWNN